MHCIKDSSCLLRSNVWIRTEIAGRVRGWPVISLSGLSRWLAWSSSQHDSFRVVRIITCHQLNSPKASFLRDLMQKIQGFFCPCLGHHSVSFSPYCIGKKKKLQSQPRLKAVEESTQMNTRR